MISADVRLSIFDTDRVCMYVYYAHRGGVCIDCHSRSGCHELIEVLHLRPLFDPQEGRTKGCRFQNESDEVMALISNGRSPNRLEVGHMFKI